jgi:putative ABC transport system permease protein
MLLGIFSLFVLKLIFMFKNYFKTTLRNLWRNKSYSALNIFGLAIGIACAGLIFLWVENEVTWDAFNLKKERLFFVMENQKYDANVSTFGSTPGLLGPAMQAEIPGVANTCRTSEGEMSYLFTIAEKSVYASGKFAEPSLFSMFTLPFVEGNPATAFKDLNSMVITEKTAKKFFGNEKNVVGKRLKINNHENYTVTGVIRDMPENSSMQFEWVAPFELYFEHSDWLHKWGNNSLNTYVELQSGAAASVDKSLYDFIQKREPASIARPFLFPMKDWHLRSDFENGKQTGGGQIEYVRLFSTIAWIILGIACINFMNLATARSEKRAREVGVRKVLGSSRKNLIFQFIGEACFMAFISAGVALIFISIALPAFNILVQKNLSLHLDSPFHFGALFAIILACGLVAGSYPSLYLSSFNPVTVLKGLKIKTASATIVRKGLVVLQFAVSIILIVSTIIIYQQIQHIKTRNLGFNKNNLLQTDVVGDVARNFDAIRHELTSTGIAENVALSDHVTLYSGNNTGGLTWDGKTSTGQVLISQRYVTPGFFNTSGMKILEGRDIRVADSAIENKTIHIVITETLAKLMGGGGSALGKSLRFEGDSSGLHAEVVGVVNDYVYGDMYGKPDPVMFFYCKPENTLEMYVRLRPGSDTESGLARIQGVFRKYNPAYPFNYVFVDEQFNNMFLNEMLISKLSRVFASLAIIISCLGLFGLAAYTAERRTKEIGIRKILGANISSITTLLSKEFMGLVVVSCLVSFPVAWLVMHNWLENYHYRIEISWWIFLAAGVSALVIALATVSFQAVRAAFVNPVKSLRSE